MYEQIAAGMSLPENNLQFIQNKPVKKMSGRQLRRAIAKGKKTNKGEIGIDRSISTSKVKGF